MGIDTHYVETKRSLNGSGGEAGAQSSSKVPQSIAHITPFKVLKFGSSILRGPKDLPRVVAEIYRYHRKGIKIIAVVSAFNGDTDRLIEEASSFGAEKDNIHAPRFISLGEYRTAALLAIACDQAGLAAGVLGARALGFRAKGHPHRADPLGIDKQKLLQALKQNDVAIIPGFVAIGESGEPVLLGRGGSDLSAMILAAELGLEEAVLLKDVDGVYEQDPAQAVGALKRYSHISYEDARHVAGELVQERAINHANRKEMSIRVGCLGGGYDTIISAKTIPPTISTRTRPIVVALAGCGVVGGAVADLLQEQAQDFQLCAMLVRDSKKTRPDSVRGLKQVSSVEALLDAQPDIIVDALSSGALGERLTEAALARGISVSSANKQALAGRLEPLHRLANEKGACLTYSAAVGGGTPMIELVRRVASSARIISIEAVTNGTVNYILSGLAKGHSFDEALKAARKAGFAEADPSADLTGMDAVAKAEILAWEGFEQAVSSTTPSQILDAALLDKISKAPGAWRQITRIIREKDDRPRISVSYHRVEEDDFFYKINDEANAIRITTRDGSVYSTKGRGAGAVPTAHSIVADLGAIRRQRA